MVFGFGFGPCNYAFLASDVPLFAAEHTGILDILICGKGRESSASSVGLIFSQW